MSTQPRLQMSAFRPYFPFLITSGVIQNGVPFTVCCCSVLLPVSEGSPTWFVCRLHPKSASFTRPDWWTSMSVLVEGKQREEEEERRRRVTECPYPAKQHHSFEQ